MRDRLWMVAAVALLGALPPAVAAPKAPHGRIELIRDRWGIPHVFAATDAGAMYGLGYAVAEDRGFQMTWSLRIMQGRAAEMLGDIPKTRGRETVLAGDRKMRTFGWTRAARRIVANLDAETRGLLAAYCEGVNDGFAANGERLHPLFRRLSVRPEPWTPADCLVSWWHLGQFFATDGTRDLMAYRNLTQGDPRRRGARGRRGGMRMPPLPPGVTPLGPDDSAAVVRREDVADAWVRRVTDFARRHNGELKPAAATAPSGPKFSHAWVVGGRRTTTGAAVLVSDPQTPVCNPSLLYEFHVQGETFNVRGIGVPGSPTILIGFNEHLAWGLTALGADQADLFRLQTDPQHPDAYFFDGRWRTMTVRQETIAVRGGRSVPLTVRETHLGPVVTAFAFARPGDPQVALKRIPLCDTERETFTANVAMWRATSAEAFGEALAGWRFPTANCVFGDRKGNIGYWVIGAIPVRSADAPSGGRAAHDGSASRFDWQTFVPHDLLPHVINPQRGFLLSGNHRPVGSFYTIPFAAMTGWSGDTTRSMRLRERLTARERFSPPDVLAVHYDDVNPARREIVRLGLHLRDTRQAGLSADARKALDVLDGWYQAGAHSSLSAPGAGLANQIHVRFRRRATSAAAVYGGGESGLTRFAKTVARRLDENPNADVPEFEGQFVDQTLADAWQAARRAYGDDPATWDAKARAAVTRRRMGWYEGLDRLPSPDRTMDMIWPALTCIDGQTITCRSAQSYTQFVPLHDADAAMTVLPPGNSEHPDSPHRTSTRDLWAAGKLHPAPLTRSAVERIATATVVLTKPDR